MKAVVFWYNTDLMPEAPAIIGELKTLMEAGTPVSVSFDCDKTGAFMAPSAPRFSMPTLTSKPIRHMSYLSDLYQISVANGWPLNDSDGLVAFSEGNVTAITNGNWAMGDYRAALGDKLAVSPIPAGPGGPSNPLLGVDGFYFNPNSENLAAAIEVAMYLTNTTAQQIMMDEAGHVPANTTVEVTDPLIQGLLDAFSAAYIRPQVDAMSIYWGNFCGVDQVFGAGIPPAEWVASAFESTNK